MYCWAFHNGKLFCRIPVGHPHSEKISLQVSEQKVVTKLVTHELHISLQIETTLSLETGFQTKCLRMFGTINVSFSVTECRF